MRALLFLFVLLVFFSCRSVSGKELKIGLIITTKPVIISVNSEGVLTNLNTQNRITRVKKNDIFSLKNINGIIHINNVTLNTSIGAFKGPVELLPDKRDGLVSYDNHWYRGGITITTNRDSQNLTVINNIEIEDYLLSVVPSEIPASWNKESLKAQAVAARSYSLGYLKRRIEKSYDLESTVEDQVYHGVKAEEASTTKAVRETEGIILIDNENRPLIALYHSSAGGYTDSIENLWDMKSSPHIQARPDFDNNSPYFEWRRNFTISELNELIKKLEIGNILQITPLSRTISNRVKYIQLKGTKKEKTIRGEEFRRLVGLPSSKFNFLIKDSHIIFSGRGFGHGLGMSQWGAKTLAERGLNYKQILTHYYPGARLVKIIEEFN